MRFRGKSPGPVDPDLSQLAAVSCQPGQYSDWSFASRVNNAKPSQMWGWTPRGPWRRRWQHLLTCADEAVVVPAEEFSPPVPRGLTALALWGTPLYCSLSSFPFFLFSSPVQAALLLILGATVH